MALSLPRRAVDRSGDTIDYFYLSNSGSGKHDFVD